MRAWTWVRPLATLALLVTVAAACGSDSTRSNSSSPANDCGGIIWSNADRHVGERVTIEGRVAGTFYAYDERGAPTFINIGYDYPNRERFTALIWREDRDTFSIDPEERYAGRYICVTGRVTTYQGIPQIEVRSPEQIEIP